MITLRVRRAASRSMRARGRVRCGRMSSRSAPSFSQVARTPMLVSTSRIRLTSSILAMPRMTVRPRLSRLAHSRATAAFLDERTAMLPLSLAPPWTRRCCGPVGPTEMSGESSASAIRLTISRLRFWLPASMRCTALWLVPSTIGQLGLGEPPMLTGVADQAADPVQVRIRHVTEQYVICEIFAGVSAACRQSHADRLLA